MKNKDYSWTQNYIGLPWRNVAEQDYGLGIGFDCMTLIESIYKERLDVEVPLLLFDGKDTAQVVKEFNNADNYQGWVATDEPKDFDVVSLYLRNIPNHVGLLLNEGILHSVQRHGVVWQPLSEFAGGFGQFNIHTYFRWGGDNDG